METLPLAAAMQGITRPQFQTARARVAKSPPLLPIAGRSLTGAARFVFRAGEAFTFANPNSEAKTADDNARHAEQQDSHVKHRLGASARVHSASRSGVLSQFEIVTSLTRLVIGAGAAHA